MQSTRVRRRERVLRSNDIARPVSDNGHKPQALAYFRPSSNILSEDQVHTRHARRSVWINSAACIVIGSCFFIPDLREYDSVVRIGFFTAGLFLTPFGIVQGILALDSTIKRVRKTAYTGICLGAAPMALPTLGLAISIFVR